MHHTLDGLHPCSLTACCAAAGVGKTTLLRDIARLMSLPPQQGGLGLAVVIVDTSNEIAGASTHLCKAG
jgi:stage III sporulation protein SpoIIIAA